MTTISYPSPISGPIRDLARESYRAGVEAGHEDAIAELRVGIGTAWILMHEYRRLRDRFNREDPGFHTYRMVADRHSFYLRELLRVRRALKGGPR